jgi:hypothetical protein
MNVNLESGSLVAAVIIATGIVTTLPARAQSPSGQTAAAAAQGASNVNVVNVPAVTVGNTELQPIPVKAPFKEPVHLSFELQIVQPYSISHNAAIYAVPAGKRFTIEHMSLHCASDTVKEAFGVLIANGEPLSYLPTRSFPIESGTASTSVGAGPVTTYVDQGNIWVYAGRSASTGTSNCTLTVLGHLTQLQ